MFAILYEKLIPQHGYMDPYIRLLAGLSVGWLVCHIFLKSYLHAPIGALIAFLNEQFDIQGVLLFLPDQLFQLIFELIWQEIWDSLPIHYYI